MKTDSLFYRIFLTAPSLFFELLGQPFIPGYRFKSIEVKQTAFRMDGVFLPPANTPTQPVYFVEVQFQKDSELYQRLFAEVFLFLKQNPEIEHWQAVVLYARRSFEPRRQAPYQVLLDSPQVHRFYLNELAKMGKNSISVELMRLIVAPKRQAATQARKVLAQVDQNPSPLPKSVIMELLETTLVYKFPQLSREELAKMLGLADSVKQTRVYQEGEVNIILRQLAHKFGVIPSEMKSQVDALSTAHLEALGEALLDFVVIDDLTTWLTEHL